MVKDNGTFSTLQQWGITPPLIPAIPSLDAVTVLPTSATPLIYPGVRFTATALAVSGPPPNYASSPTYPGNITITVSTTDIAKIQLGTLVNISGITDSVAVDGITVDGSGNPAFTVYAVTAPTSPFNIVSYEESVTAPTQFSSISASINAAFDGTADEGYSTDDVVHIAVAMSDASVLLDFRLRVLVNGSASDYYEKSISPSAIQSQVTGTDTASAQLSTLTPQINSGAVGPFDIPYTIAQQAKAQPIQPTAPVSQTNVV